MIKDYVLLLTVWQDPHTVRMYKVTETVNGTTVETYFNLQGHPVPSPEGRVLRSVALYENLPNPRRS